MQRNQVSSPIDATLELMREIFHGVSQRQDDAFLHTELSLAQIKALVAIGKAGEPSVGVMAKKLNIGLSAASQIVERLVKADLVERHAHPSDRRIIQLRLTAQGTAMFERFESGPRRLTQWLDAMDERDLKRLQQGLSALVHVIRSHEDKGDIV